MKRSSRGTFKKQKKTHCKETLQSAMKLKNISSKGKPEETKEAGKKQTESQTQLEGMLNKAGVHFSNLTWRKNFGMT